MKKILVIMLSMVLVVIFTACGGGSAEIDKKDIAESIEKVEMSEEVTAEEKEEVEKLQKEYTEKIAKAKDAKEAAKLKEEFEEKANAATDNKVTVPVSRPTSSSPSDSNSSGSSSSSGSTKPNTNNESQSDKPNTDNGSSGNNKPDTGISSSGKPSIDNSSSSGSAKPSTPSHTHITEGDMGWADSPEEIRGIYEARRADWKAKVAAGDHTSPEPINYNYQKCGCGKYTGSIVYGNPHTCIAAGNTGMWFDTRDECEAYYNSELSKLGDKWDNGEITTEEYGQMLFGWQGKQCSCGRWTVSFFTLN